jgi:hypothetical protein
MFDVSADNLLSGLVGGLVAAIIAIAGAWWLQRSATLRQNKMTTRAVYQELVANGTNLLLLSQRPGKTASLVSVTDHAWTTHAGAVAVSLPAGDYQCVSLAYKLLPMCRWVILEWQTRQALDGEIALLRLAARAANAASQAMQRHVWSKRELADRDAATTAMQAQVEKPMEGEDDN